MDIGLKHGLNGIELTKIIRKMTEYSKVPIIAVTAYTLAKDKEDIFNACLLYTSDAADERSSVDLGGSRIIKKKKHINTQ